MAVQLSWQVSATWDFNADGFLDIIVTAGHDAGPFAAMPQMVYLQQPGCYDASCQRYVPVEIPIDYGHYHGLAPMTVQSADGAWHVLAVLNTSVEAQPSVPTAFLWTTTEEKRWVSLAVGAMHDLRAIGSRVRMAFYDDAGQQIPSTTEALLALTPTWGSPGFNGPLIMGVPAGATRMEAELDLPRCHSSVSLVITEFNRPYNVGVPPCPG
jgi:hypothetical protein